MLTKRAGDWGDKVKIIGISIDQTADAVVKHCEAKGWNKPIHYHRAKSDCSQQYAVSGVPNVMIVDTDGKIVFKGHPASRPDLEADFDTLLKGEKITGAGTEEVGGPKGGDEAASGKEMDAAACLDNITKFKEAAGTALVGNEEVKKHVATMPRAFCVMVYEESYDVAKDKSLVDWKNYRVLVGKQEAIDACKKAIEDNVSGEFEVVLRE